MSETPRGKTVLVLEDDQRIRKLLTEISAQANYRSLGAATVRDALDILHHEQVDLILLDMKLPGLDGQHFLRFLRKQGHTTSSQIAATKPSLA